MATKKVNAEISDNTKDDCFQMPSNTQYLENCHLGKVLAFRAVYGSTSGFQRRKTRGNDSKTSSPSRLSKVTYTVVVDDTNNYLT